MRPASDCPSHPYLPFSVNLYRISEEKSTSLRHFQTSQSLRAPAPPRGSPAGGSPGGDGSAHLGLTGARSGRSLEAQGSDSLLPHGGSNGSMLHASEASNGSVHSPSAAAGGPKAPPVKPLSRFSKEKSHSAERGEVRLEPMLEETTSLLAQQSGDADDAASKGGNAEPSSSKV